MVAGERREGLARVAESLDGARSADELDEVLAGEAEVEGRVGGAEGRAEEARGGGQGVEDVAGEEEGGGGGARGEVLALGGGGEGERGCAGEGFGAPQVVAAEEVGED